MLKEDEAYNTLTTTLTTQPFLYRPENFKSPDASSLVKIKELQLFYII